MRKQIKYPNRIITEFASIFLEDAKAIDKTDLRNPDKQKEILDLIDVWMSDIDKKNNLIRMCWIILYQF